MDPLEREFIANFYTKQLRMHGDTPEALHWSLQGQMLRFNAIVDLIKPNKYSTLLDYGCGKADLYDYMLKKGIRTRYTGADITPGFIEMAQDKYPECDFHVHDIEDDGPVYGGTFDFVIVCGVFNNMLDGATKSMLNSVRLLFKQTGNTLVLNGLSALAIKKDFGLNYIDPDELLCYVKANITHNVSVRLDIIKDDLFLILKQ